MVDPSLLTNALSNDPRLLPIPIFLALTATYLVVAPYFPDSKSRAYILSAISSLTLSITSLPFVYAYATTGFAGMLAAGREGWMKPLSEFIVTAFGTYLSADLLIGSFAYPDQIGMLTGWIHHIVYIGIMVYLAQSTQSPIFMTGAIMELPTFDLAISHLVPSLRNDERFLTLMAATRILFNLVLVLDVARPSSIAVAGNIVPACILSLSLALHASWMHGGVKGYLKRRSKARKAAAAEAAKAEVETTPATPALTALSPDFGPLTPEESPLVTPHTPSQPALYIRDGLFPNITIPTMPNLPIPAIPTLSDMAAAIPQAKESLNSLNFGFKEAVRERWEEQRERLAARGLRLRRREPVTVSEVM